MRNENVFFLVWCHPVLLTMQIIQLCPSTLSNASLLIADSQKYKVLAAQLKQTITISKFIGFSGAKILVLSHF